MSSIFIRSVADFCAAVQLGSTLESLVLDFKGEINGWNAPKGKEKPREEAQKETCRDIAQFANTFGGCILIGVKERTDPTRRAKVADSIESVKEVDTLRKWIEDSIKNYLVPSTLTHYIDTITLPQQKNVLAVNVPASRYLVALWDRKKSIEYVRRTNYGKEYMNPNDVERHLMDGSRAAKLALIAAKKQAKGDQVEIAGGLWEDNSGSSGRLQRCNPKTSIKLGRMEEYWFELCIELRPPQVSSVTIPYSLIKETWVNSVGRITLLLAVRIVGFLSGTQVARIELEAYSA